MTWAYMKGTYPEDMLMALSDLLIGDGEVVVAVAY
jgi:hypothetical protein